MVSPLMKTPADSNDNTLDSKARKAMFLNYQEPDSPGEFMSSDPPRLGGKMVSADQQFGNIDNRRITISPNVTSESNKQRINTMQKRAFYKSNL